MTALRFPAALIVVLWGVTGCVSAAGDFTGGHDTHSRNDVITRAEVCRAEGAVTVADVIRHLRPQFMHGAYVMTATGAQVTPPAVYVDGRYIGGPAELEALPLELLAEVRQLSPAEARVTFGPLCRCAGGSIAIRTLAPRDMRD